jgi:hypothetical protein
LKIKAKHLNINATGQPSDSGSRLPDQYPTDAARTWIIGAALVALFLGAVDALVMSAAMPTIVAELGGLAYTAGSIPPIFCPGRFFYRPITISNKGRISDYNLISSTYNLICVPYCASLIACVWMASI